MVSRFLRAPQAMPSSRAGVADQPAAGTKQALNWVNSRNLPVLNTISMYRREQVSFLLYWFYQFYRLLVTTAFRVYFRRVVFIGSDVMHTEGPCLFVSNHPNTMIDPLLVAYRSRRIMFFLANASLFRHPFTNWFFTTFYCIPIERPQDTGGKPLNNDASFARCNEFLSRGGCLYIAPEGSSWMERRLRDMRTGTARIALSAEEYTDFRLQLRIVPFGLTYTQPHRFQGEVVVHAGEPVSAIAYAASYREDPAAAIRALTEAVENRLRALMVDIPPEIEEKTLRFIEQMLQNERPADTLGHYQRSKDLLTGLREMKSQHPASFDGWFGQVEEYAGQLMDAGVEDREIKMSQNINYYTILLYISAIVTGLPLFLFGVASNFLAAGIPLCVIRVVKPYIGYYSTFKILVGLVSFPLFYYLQMRWVMSFLRESTGWVVLAYLLLSFSTLYVILPYIERWRKLLAAWRLIAMKRRDPERLRQLCASRTALLSQLAALPVISPYIPKS